jgi:acetyl-CoA carboxylase biotin carboxyl carrier protein
MIQANADAVETALKSCGRHRRFDRLFHFDETHTMIDIRKLKELVRLMVENELTEIDLHDQQETVTIKRGTEQGTVVQHQPVIYGGGGGGGAAPAPAPVAAPAAAPAAPVAEAAVDSNQQVIESPMVGTFYTKPTPDAKPFVSVGDHVGPDTVVCLVEAMKVFNEIKAEQSGVVEKILVADGDAVEFGQAMIVLK